MDKEEFKSIAKRYYQGSLKTVTKEEFENALDELLKDEYNKDIILKYQEQIDEKELYELAYHHSMNNGYENLNEDEIITDEYKLTWGDIIGDIEKAYKAGYRKAMEE